MVALWAAKMAVSWALATAEKSVAKTACWWAARSVVSWVGQMAARKVENWVGNWALTKVDQRVVEMVDRTVVE